MKKALLVVSAAGALIAALTPMAFAETSPATTSPAPATCGITADDLAAIAAIQNNASLSYGSELQQELAARKSLLKKTISCAQASAEQDKKDLDDAEIDPKLQGLKSQWSDRLDGAISYYDLQLQKIDNAGISGTEAIAKEVLSWRQDNYAPLAENVSNFLTWSNNQPLFSVAANRLAEVDNLVNSPLFSENTDLQNDYEQAAVALKTADDQNTQAQNALSQSLPPDQSLLLIEQSFISLSAAYQHFFDISNLVQSLLPH